MPEQFGFGRFIESRKPTRAGKKNLAVAAVQKKKLPKARVAVK